jgi:MFS family permease
LLQLTSFVSTFDRFAMPPMLVVIAHDLGVPLAQVVNAAGAYFLTYGLAQPVWGLVSDSLGRVRTMRLTLLVAGLMTIGSAFAMTPVVLGVARALAGGFFGSAYPNSLIYLGDTVPAERRQVEITRLMVGVALGTAAASVGAGAAAQLFTWRAAFVVTGLAALALVVLLGSLEEPPRGPRGHPLAPLADVLRSRTARLVLLLAFVEGAVLLGVLTLLPSAVQATGASSTVAGAVTGVYGAAVFCFARMVGRLSRSRHPSRLIAWGGAAAVAACAVLAVSRTPVPAIVVAVLLGLAWAAMHSSLQTWATEVAPDARAAVVSLFAGSLFVGSAVAAVAVADLADAGRYATVFAASGVLAVPLTWVATRARARWVRPGEARA